MKKYLVSLFGCLMAVVFFCGCAYGSLNAAPDAGEGVWGGAMEDAPWISDGENYQYDSIIEQGFYDVQTTPSSYFSLDRNTAGYSFVRAQIRQNVFVSPDSVRLEELVNYFDYDYPLPQEGEAVGVSAYFSECPWNTDHALMTIGIRTEEAVVGGDTNYVLLIDVSGSMGGSVYGSEGMSRLDLVKYGANKLIDGLGENDRVSIVTYASGVKTVLESTAATQSGKTAIRNALSRLTAYGSTSGSDGLELAYEQAEAHKAENGNNRVILLTDGDFNVGIYDTDELTEFIQEKARSGIALSVVGVGLGNTRDDLMQTLALNGNGNYSYMDTQLESEKIFTEELAGTLYTVAYDAKAGVTFNGERVSSYRLLGYDMKTISEDDFDNPNKDTGEIGSNLCVTALYELELLPSNADTETALAQVSVRYRDAEDLNREVVLTVTGEESSAEDTQFAACVAEFALVLRQSSYRGDASLENVLARLNGLESYLAEDVYKQEFLQIVALAEQSGLYDITDEEGEEFNVSAS